jgi:hypothetical protein
VTSVTLIRARSSYNHTYKLDTYVYICVFVFCVCEYVRQMSALLSVSPRDRDLSLHYNQLSALPPDVFAGLSMLE